MFGRATPRRAAIYVLAGTLTLAACGAEHDVLTSGAATAGDLVRGAASEPSATSAVPSPATTGTSASPALAKAKVVAAETTTTAAETTTSEAEPSSTAAPATTAATAAEPSAEALAAAGGAAGEAVGEAPAPPTTLGAPVIENRSSCRQGLDGSVAVMVIPSISYVCPVFRGGQRTIDSGAATWFTGWPDRSEQASTIGGPGTVWMAGHRTSHGAPFFEIPNIADGADVTFFVGAEAVTYRIVGRMMFTVDSAGFVLSDTDGDGDLEGSAQAGYRAIFRDDLGGGMVPRLVLQTCDGRDGRWILYADRVA
jgi:hypothetical protein